VLQFVRELAAYEKLTHEAVATETMIDAALFGESPRVFADLAEWNGAPVGLALWFLNFSTFSGRYGLYLEDLFVDPDHRNKGVGKALFGELGKIAEEKNCGRLDWSVLKWNTPSIDFYEKALQAKSMTEWLGMRLEEDGIENLRKFVR